MKTKTRKRIISAIVNTLRVLPRRLTPLARQIAWNFLSPEVRVVNGITQHLRSDSDWIVFQEIFVERQYDDAITQSLIESKNLDSIHVVDIGANAGLFTSRYILLFCNSSLKQKKLDMTLVEGSPPTAETLYNSLHGSHDLIKINVINGLAGKRAGCGYIQSNQQFSGVTLRVADTEPNSEAVPYIDIDSLTRSAPFIDLLKCDIEGSEELFIECNEQLFHKTRNAVFEFHPDLCDVKRCVKLLADYGLVHVRTEIGELFVNRSIDYFQRKSSVL